ncbi:MAG: DNA-directed RNA polymerase subunit omega [Acidobacteria bacterium]|nr:DNA-directed RNA polymerase subunit omega [Acidobacteriota bacterium]
MLKFPDRIDSKFRFVLLSAQRAEQLVRGAQPKIEQGLAKPSRIAMKEICDDLIDWDYGPVPEVDVEEVASAEVLES